jgi:hypothetical protein
MTIQNRLQTAVENGVVDTAQRATTGFFSWIGGIFTSVLSIGFWGGLIAFVADLFFPQIGFRGWISDIMEKLGIKGMFNGLLAMLSPETAESIAKFAEDYIPLAGKNIASMLRNAPREAILAMNDDEFEKTMRERTGVPEIGAELRKVSQKFKDFLKANTTIDPRLLTSKEGITALLGSDDGRAVVGAILTGYDAARGENGSIRQRAANAPASDMETKLPAALRAVIADQAAFTRIMLNQQNRELIYRAAPLAAAAAGIRVTDPRAFTQGLTSALTPLPPPQQAAFFTALANPDQPGAAGAMMRLYYDSRVPSAALIGMVRNITVADSAPEALRGDIASLQRAASNPQQFENQRRTVQEVGQQTVAGLLNPQTRITALAEAATRQNNRITGAQIATLMGPAEQATPAEPPIYQLLRDPEHADNVLSFIRTVGAENFPRLANQVMQAPGQTAAGSSPATEPSPMATAFLDIFKDQRRTEALIRLHGTLGEANFNSLVMLMGRPTLPVREMTALVSRLPMEQQRALVSFVETLPNGRGLAANINSLITLPQAQQQAFATILQGLPDEAINKLLPLLHSSGNQLNVERIMTLLMDDEIRRGLTGKEAALSALLVPRLPPAMQAFATPENLAATLRLANAIDTNTGSTSNTQAEAAADKRNAQVIGLMMNLAQGNRSALEGQDITALGGAIAEVMREQKHVEAFREFLESFDTTSLDARQQRVFNAIKEKWWTDVNGDRQFQPRRQGQGNGNMQHTSYGDGGLAAFLANPEAARILLEFISTGTTTTPRVANNLGVANISFYHGLGIGTAPTHPDLRALQAVLPPVTPSPPAGAVAAPVTR